MKCRVRCQILFGLVALLQFGCVCGKRPEKDHALMLQTKVENLIEKILQVIEDYYHQIRTELKCIPDEVPDTIIGTLKNAIDCVDQNERNYDSGHITANVHKKAFLKCFSDAKTEVEETITSIDPNLDYCPENMTEKTYQINVTTTFTKTFHINIKNGLEIMKKKVHLGNEEQICVFNQGEQLSAKPNQTAQDNESKSDFSDEDNSSADENKVKDLYSKGHHAKGHESNGHHGKGHEFNGRPDNGHESNDYYSSGGEKENFPGTSVNLASAHGGNESSNADKNNVYQPVEQVSDDNGQALKEHHGKGHESKERPDNDHKSKEHHGTGNESKESLTQGHESKERPDNDHKSKEHHGTGHESKERPDNDHKSKEHHGTGHESKESLTQGHESKERPDNDHKSKEHHGTGHESKERPDNDHKSKEHHGTGHESKESLTQGHESKEHHGTGYESKESLTQGHESKEHHGTGHESKESLTQGHESKEHHGTGHESKESLTQGHVSKERPGKGHEPKEHHGKEQQSKDSLLGMNDSVDEYGSHDSSNEDDVSYGPGQEIDDDNDNDENDSDLENYFPPKGLPGYDDASNDDDDKNENEFSNADEYDEESDSSGTDEDENGGINRPDSVQDDDEESEAEGHHIARPDSKGFHGKGHYSKESYDKGPSSAHPPENYEGIQGNDDDNSYEDGDAGDADDDDEDINFLLEGKQNTINSIADHAAHDIEIKNKTKDKNSFSGHGPIIDDGGSDDLGTDDEKFFFPDTTKSKFTTRPASKLAMESPTKKPFDQDYYADPDTEPEDSNYGNEYYDASEKEKNLAENLKKSLNQKLGQSKPAAPVAQRIQIKPKNQFKQKPNKPPQNSERHKIILPKTWPKKGQPRLSSQSITSLSQSFLQSDF